jgi:hypothetical protein
MLIMIGMGLVTFFNASISSLESRETMHSLETATTNDDQSKNLVRIHSLGKIFQQVLPAKGLIEQGANAFERAHTVGKNKQQEPELKPEREYVGTMQA